MGTVVLKSKLHRLVHRPDPVKQSLPQSILIFAPHQDDETLGCGGTIIKKRATGADVRIVFMCDGALSHAHLMPARQLKAVRAREAVAAARMLGVAQDHLFFLDFKEGCLLNRQADAVDKVQTLIDRYQPDEVFMPYHRDIHPDHEATNTVVQAALRTSPRSVVVYEYPIWFWYHWPQVGVPRRLNRPALRLLRNTIRTGFGLRARRTFRYALFVADVLDQKRTALNQYASQMTPLVPDVGWSTLGDVANGEFLPLFFQDCEVFYRYRVGAEQNMGRAHH